MIDVNNMILLGATARNTGKTTLAVKLIELHSKKRPVVGVKVVTVQNHGDSCPRGGKGCGICSGLKDSFDIREETGCGDKDTMLFKKAGARIVYLVRSHPEGLAEAVSAVLKLTAPSDLIICESNSVRTVARPMEFIMMQDHSGQIKPSARKVLDQADRILTNHQDYFL